MSKSYSGVVSSTQKYINHLYNDGFNQSQYLSNHEIITICENAGIFKLKGYVKEVKHLKNKNIDDVLIIYLFDRYFSKILFDITSRIESKIKSTLITECYKRTTNHFFYLMKKNHKWQNFKVDIPTINNWKIHTTQMSQAETYSHYILFYLQNYNFQSNKSLYLQNTNIIDIDDTKYNYPPFKYLVESATLGSIIAFIKSVKIGNTDIYSKMASNFGLGSNDVFKHYLERLNEIRNRVAHGGRIFNRTFRSATGIGKYRKLRSKINNHKSLDVYIFLFFLSHQLEKYNNLNEFKQEQIEKLFCDFKNDTLSNTESFNLIEKYNIKDFESIKKIVYEKMSR